MPEYRDITVETAIPRGVGVEGLIALLRKALRKRHVSRIEITEERFTYTRLARVDEPEEEGLAVDLPSLRPYAIVRSLGEAIEEVLHADKAGQALTQMFLAAHTAGLNPIAFVAAPNSYFWRWYSATEGLALPKDELFGYQVRIDPDAPREALLLCLAYSRNAELLEARKVLKITVPPEYLGVGGETP